jgi:hypothetical protein
MRERKDNIKLDLKEKVCELNSFNLELGQMVGCLCTAMTFDITRGIDKAGIEVLTAASMKIAVFWVVVQSSLVEVYRRFRRASYGYYQGDGGSKYL